MPRPDPLRQPEEAIRRLYAYAAYRLGHGPDAEDIVSETIERALRYRDSFDPSSGSPIAWMIGIANRCIADTFRERSQRVAAEVDHIPGAQEDFSSELVARSDVRAAVGRLDERDRELIALRYGADLSAREIGNVLSLRTNTVEVALHRALTKLRSSLDVPGARDEATQAGDSIRLARS